MSYFTKYIKFISLVVLLGFALPASDVSAQVITATIRGKINDSQGGGLPNAKISARQIDTNATSSIVSGSLGQYYLPSLPAGKYEVTVEASGFGTIRRSIELFVGSDLTIDFTLQVGTVETKVEVSGDISLLETTTAEVSQTLRKDQIDNLPTVNRDFSSLALLAPGVSPGVGGNGSSLAINGQRGYQNNVYIDGSSNQWQYYGRQASTFSQDWIQEFQVMTNSYSAEFGSASGGILNVITRSGSNDWHARAYLFYRAKALDSPPFSGAFTNNDPSKPIFLTKDEVADYTQRRWGGYVGGPIIRDKLFFFAGYEDLDRGSSDQLAISDYWKGLGFKSVLPTKTTDHPFLVRGDYNITSNNRLSMRYDRTIQKSVDEGGPYTVESGRDTFGGPVWNVVANLTSTLNNTSFNEFRFGYMSNMPPIVCNLSGTGGIGNLELGPPGTFSEQLYPTLQTGCPIFTGTEGEQNLTLHDNYAFVRGHHQVKFGGELRRNTLNDNITNFHDGYWAFAQDLQFDLADPNSYPYFFIGNVGPGKFKAPIWNYNLFVQDTWQIRSGLTLNLGLRYDVDRSVTAGNQFIEAKNQAIIDQYGGTAPLQKTNVDYNNFSPRLGFAWTPTSDHKTTVRGAFGLFYDQNHGNFNAIYIINTLLSNGLNVVNCNSPITNPYWNPADTATSRTQCRSWFAQNFPLFPDLSIISHPTQGIDTLDPDLQVPFTTQYTAGVSHEFIPGLVVSADFIHSRGSGLEFFDRNERLQPDGSVESIDPRFTTISELRNTGYVHYTALQIDTQYRKKAANFGLAYTLSKTNSDLVSGSVFGSNPTNPFNLSQDIGPDDTDQRHNLVFNGAYDFPLGFQLSGIAVFRSARPWSVTTNENPTDAAFPDRPAPKNSRRGDSQKTVDFRIGKTFKFKERLQASVFWEMYNAFNWTSYTTYDTLLESTTFGLPNAAADPRRQQLGLRFDF